MKMFALLASFVTLTSSAAVIDGCYKTISYNGQSVVQGPDAEQGQTKIYSIQSPYYFSHEGKALETKIISVFKGFDEGWYSYVNPIIFEKLGETQETESSWTHSFEGYVKYASSYYDRTDADFQTSAEFEWRADGLLEGRVFQQTKILDRDMDFEVVLEKAVCSID